MGLVATNPYPVRTSTLGMYFTVPIGIASYLIYNGDIELSGK